MTTQQAQEKLKAYSEKGLLPGGFLQAILENNLIEAVKRADSESLQNLVAITKWAWDQLPQSIWGSKEAVQKHINKHRGEPIIEAKGSGGAGCGFGHPRPEDDPIL